MASRLYDAFNRNATTTLTALGTSDSGQPYVDLSSSAGATGIRSNAARLDAAATLALAVLDAGVGGGDGEIGITLLGKGAGLGAYFRVVDAANWWRAYERAYTYQYQTGTETYVSGYTQTFSHYESVLVGYTPKEYEWTHYYKTGITHDYDDMYGMHTPEVWGTSSTTPPPYSDPISHAHYLAGTYYPGDDSSHNHRYSHSAWTGATRGGDPIYEQRAVYVSTPVYSTRPIFATATGYDLRLEKRVAGVLTTVAARQITGPFSRIYVSARGDKIHAYVFSHGWSAALSATDATHQAATRHGFGRGKPSELEAANTDLIDDFYFNPTRSGSILPPVMR